MRSKRKENERVIETVLTEKDLTDNIAKSNEEAVEAVPEPEKKKRFQFIKKKPFIIGCLVFVVLVLCLLCFLFLGGSQDEETLAKNFTITSIEPKTEGNYISNNETFIVKTSAANEDIVRTHLYIEPAVNYEVKKINSKEYEVTLSNVPSDTLVNLSLVKNEVKSYSWAFQSTKDLKVISTYPTNGASTVSTNSYITIVLSYPNVEDFENHFSIEPHVDGTLTQYGRTWRFTPTKELKNDTNYTITISKGLKAGDYTLEESYTTSFSTYNRPQNNNEYNNSNQRLYKHSYITIDSINTFSVGEQVSFKMYMFEENPVNKIKMHKFNSYDDFMKFLNNENKYKTTDLGEQQFSVVEKYNSYVLTNNFGEGYYALEVYLSNGELYTTIPVQINKLSAYMFASDNDLLVWVGSGNELLKGINVTYNGQNYKTDGDGIATIKNYNDESYKVRYVNVGDKTNPLVIGINSFEKYDYPEGYIYTDKPIYKNTDKVSIWGYVPLKFYESLYDDFKKQDFVLVIDEENVPIEINDDGTFTTKYLLDNHVDGYMSVSLKYKNGHIAYRGFEVKNYSKQNYEYDVKMDKNYVVAGKNFEFDIHVNHVSGIAAQNKVITVEYNDKVYNGSTNGKGDVHFTIPTKRTDDNYGVSWQYVYIKTGDSEYNENDLGFDFYVVNHELVFKDQYSNSYDSKTKTDSGSIVLIDGNKKVDSIDYGNFQELLKVGDYNGPLSVQLVEVHYQKQFAYTYYNEFTNKSEDIYNYVEVGNNVVESDSINVVNGKYEYKIKYDMKQNTEMDNYSYHLNYIVSKNNDKVENSSYVFDYDIYEYQQYGKEIYSDFWGETGSGDYNYYKYYITRDTKNKYSVGDFIRFTLASYNGAEIGNNSKILKIGFKNNIISKQVLKSDSLEFSEQFLENAIPGIGYTGALFKDGNFYRFPSYYYDYNEEDSKLNVEIIPSKDKYSPGEKVKLTINVKDQNGKGVKSRLNLSVVDKAVFNVVSDTTNILDTIYSNINYRSYTYSSHRDLELGMERGGMGDANGGETRTKFSDTVYFKEIETDENGNAVIEFELNDSVTTFVATVHAANRDAYVGVGKKEISSTLPLAISVIEPNGLKEADDAVISANSIGDVTGDINYVFELVGTDKKIEKKAGVGTAVYANFGNLEEGEYKVRIIATSGNERDAIEFPFVVKKTQQEISVKTTSTIDDLKSIKPTKNPIVLEFYKSSFATYIKYLDILIGTNQDRLDTKVAYYKGLEYENKYYDYSYPINISDMNKFNNNGVLRYLENGGNSYFATAMVNYLYPSLYKLDKAVFYGVLEETTDANLAMDALLVLASMKEPVLDELKYMSRFNENTLVAKLALAYALIGDYNSAALLYKNLKITEESQGIVTILVTMIDKEKASSMIDELYNKNIADEYVYFAILSYFLNNEYDLSRESTIKVSYGDTNKEVKLKGLTMKKLVINNKDLETLNISSNDKDDMINYYYEGGISEIDENNIKKDITISLSNKNISVGQSVDLVLDLSKLGKISGNLKIYLPNSMRLSGNMSSTKGVYLNANRGEYLIIYVSEDHSSTARIPLYVTYPGNYKIEEVILKIDDQYHISNSLDVNIK